MKLKFTPQQTLNMLGNNKYNVNSAHSSCNELLNTITGSEEPKQQQSKSKKSGQNLQLWVTSCFDTFCLKIF